jgi:tetratricopeptide (TPR) repeat protein
MKKRLWCVILLCLALAAPVWALGEEEAPTLTEDEYLEQALRDFLNGDYGLAVETLSRMLAAYPNNAEGYFLRGFAYQALARPTLALDDFTRAIGLQPYQWSFYLARGDVFATIGEPDSALNDYQTSIDLNPRYAEGYAALARIYNTLGNRERARSYELMARGVAAYQQGDLSTARRTLNEALERISGDDILKAYAYYNRGLVSFEEGNLEAVAQDATLGMDFFPEMHDLYLLRGIVYRQQGNLQGAGEDFLRRITLLEDTTRQRAQIENGGISNMDYGVVDELIMTCAVGSRATIRVVDIDEVGVDALITVLDPQGVPIAGDDDFGRGRFELDALITDLPITSDGPYTILISHANGGYTGRLQATYTCRS